MTLESRAADAEAALTQLRAQLVEATKMIELQKGDLDRYKAAYEHVQPNTPERVDKDQLQLALDGVLQSMSGVGAAQQLASEVEEEQQAVAAEQAENPRRKKRHSHGRRPIELSKLPVDWIVIDPDDVVAVNGEGYECIGEETAEKLGFRRGGFRCVRFVRRKWVKKFEVAPAIVSAGALPTATVSIAPVPESVWPTFMADPSSIAQHIIAKYADCLPLHRQEAISARNGFAVPRSTQCGWLTSAHRFLRRITEAMMADAIRRSFCIATDATGAPVRSAKKCELWRIFVFVADRDHVLFRHSKAHTSEAIRDMLLGYRGHLLADASSIYDIVYRDGVTEVACWFHLRRYFWRAIPTDPHRAYEALSLIARLFKIESDCRDLGLAEHTAIRAQRAKPVLDVLDAWIAKNRAAADPRGPLSAGIGYYENQRTALHRFLDDGRLRLDNSVSEQQLRNAVLGRSNWIYYQNETGLRWYTTFRSLIASCLLQDINPHDYLEQVLRLAPHWPVNRVLELAPKYWSRTRAGLNARHRAILEPPWEREWPTVTATSPPRRQVA